MSFFRRLRQFSRKEYHSNDLTPVGSSESFFARLLSHRLMELAALGLLIISIAICLSLYSYNPKDPSFNTATGTVPTNLLGRAGATLAEFLIELLGLSCTLPVIILLAWTWQLMRHHSIHALPLRLFAAILLLPAGSFLVGTIQTLIPGLDILWPSKSGLGGEVGVSLAHYTLNALHDIMGASGNIVTFLISLLLISLLTPITLGLSHDEWRYITKIIAFLLSTPFRLIKKSLSPTKHTPPHQEKRIFTPNPPNIVTGTSLYERPSSFLLHKHRPTPPEITTPPPMTPQTWITPPQTTQKNAPLAPLKEDAHHSLEDNAQPINNAHAEKTPPNPYAEKLAFIHRDKEHTPQPPPPPTIEVEYTENLPEDEIVATHPAPPPTLKKPSFLERLTQRPTPPENIIATNQPTDHVASQIVDNFQPWQVPSLSLLKPAPSQAQTGPSQEILEQNARLLENVLNDYGVQGAIQDYRPGPVVTLYELEPAAGVRSSRVIGLSDDIARSLAVLSVRIATVPGRNVIGIEVPNETRETVYFPELLNKPQWKEDNSKLLLALGKDISGEPIYADLAKMPHLLVAGTTGSGKSVGINAMILSLLYRLSPEDCRLILIDPKILELSIYEGIPHLMTPVVTEPHKAVSALKWAVQEMDRRYRLIAAHQVRNINNYNERIKRLRSTGEAPTQRIQTGFDPETGHPIFDEQRLPLEHLPYIVIVIDEMADLMMTAGKEIEAAVLRLAQKARAAGVHLIMATQRPSVDVITGTIKANFPTRISFQVTNKYDSRTILGEQGAEQLLGRGDMLFMHGGSRITRVHGPFISDEEVEDVVNDLRSKGQPVYNADVVSVQEEENNNTSKSSRNAGDNDGNNDLYEEAVALVIREKRASTSFVQRSLNIGYNRAANITDQMERDGIISPANHVGRREILVTSLPETERNGDEG